MTQKKAKGTNIETLAELVRRHDTKLSLDYQRIERLEVDTREVNKNVGSLSDAVHTLSGAVGVQSKIVNSILGITVIAFLGFMVNSVYRPNSQPDPRAIADAVMRVVRSEVSRQIPTAHATSGENKSAKIKKAAPQIR